MTSARQVPDGVAARGGPPLREVGPLSQTDVLRFAGASGDFNPLHWDPELARRVGFGAPVVMGQLTAGILAGWLTDWCGIENLRELEVRFVSPVIVGDTLVLEGQVTDGAAGESSVVVTAAVGERVVATATARVAV